MNNFHPHEIPTALFADCLANSQAIFQLIDTVFPIDSCRHYELLPLSLVEKDLTIGMLDPNNEESLKFIDSIVNVFKYNLTLKLIDLQTHQIILASYPRSSPQKPKSARQDRNHTVIDHSFSSEAIPLNQAQRDRRNLADSAPTIISIPDNPISEQNSASGLEDLPPDLDFLKDLELTSDKPVQPDTGDTGTLYEIPPEFRVQKNANDSKATIIAANPAELLAEEAEIDPNAEAQISALIAEAKGETALKEIETNDFLPEIQSQLSWQKLLESAFRHHTHQIILTRHSDRGSIVANDNENLQSTIEQLPLPTFCSLIDEIKRMARIPQNISNHSKKVVLERIYEEERILLRLEFTAELDTETVIVNILRDRKLQAYEQKQMDRISEHALQHALQLEKALRKIQACFDSAEINNLAELQTVQSRINHQLRLLDKL